MRALRWIWHWGLQGLKLVLFIFVALMATVPLKFPLAWLEDWQATFTEPPPSVELTVIFTKTIVGIIGLAVFAFLLASQLKAHPLQWPEPPCEKR